MTFREMWMYLMQISRVEAWDSYRMAETVQAGSAVAFSGEKAKGAIGVIRKWRETGLGGAEVQRHPPTEGFATLARMKQAVDREMGRA